MFKSFQESLYNLDPDDPGLLQLVFEGRVVLPEFQRKWIWQPARVTSLIHSIARGWPAGSLLLMDGTRDFPSRALDGVSKKPRKNANYSVLDGQQRLTALFQSYYDVHRSHVFPADLRAMVGRGEIAEDDFDSETRTKWNRRYSTLKDQAQDGRLLVGDLIDDNRFEEWLKFLPDGEDPADYRTFRQLRLENLTKYVFHASVIEEKASPEVLTAVFSTINQQGVALNTFDLMVAVSWQEKRSGQKGYHLRGVWEGAATYGDTAPTYPRLANFSLKPIVALRLVKLMKSRDGSVSDAEILKRLDGADVRGKFEDALRSLDAAFKFLHDHCGVVPETLPHEATVLPIAFILHQNPAITRKAEARQKLVRWFWGSSFQQRYGRGGTNTRIVGDSDDLEKWVLGGEAEPSWLENFWSGFDRGALVETETGNGMLLRAILCLQNDVGAKDWRTGEPIRDMGRQPQGGSTEATSVLQRHHVFPQDVRIPDDREALDSGEIFGGDHELVVNRVLIRANTNKELQATPPSALADRACDWGYVSSHLVDPDKLDEWANFVQSRVDSLEAELKTRLPE